MTMIKATAIEPKDVRSEYFKEYGQRTLRAILDDRNMAHEIITHHGLRIVRRKTVGRTGSFPLEYDLPRGSRNDEWIALGKDLVAIGYNWSDIDTKAWLSKTYQFMGAIAAVDKLVIGQHTYYHPDREWYLRYRNGFIGD